MGLTVKSERLEESYRLCERMARRSNFYHGIRLLPAQKRRSMLAVYAFMRYCDDISDAACPVSEKMQRFAAWKESFAAILNGGAPQHPILPALKDAIERHRIPVAYFYKLVEGTEMDLEASRYESFDDLYRYCYHVASVVGLVCIHIFGFEDERSKEYAEACGIAFQLTNVLRDIREDLERDRIYLPREELARFDYSENELQECVYNPAFQRLMEFQVERAKSYYQKAYRLIELIERDSRPTFWAMVRAYETLLQRIEANEYDVFSSRVRLNSREKLQIISKALLRR